MTKPDAAQQIADVMSGHEWSADTLNQIADILRAHGYAVLDIADQDDADDGPSLDAGAQTFSQLIEDAAEAVDQFGEDELERHAAEFARCPMCGGEGRALGQLGCLLHLRCRACGWDFSREVPK